MNNLKVRLARCASLAFSVLVVGTFFLASDAARTEPAAETVSPHLTTAEQLVTDIQGATMNVYGGGKRFIDWEQGHYAARTVCSSFVTLVLEHTYNWTDDDFKGWMGRRDPDASDYHDAIANSNGFKRFHKISSLPPGDLLAIKYADGSEDTGHVVIVASRPEERQASEPLVAGTTQYEVSIIDSSKSGHGPTDTRHLPGGGFSGGIGRGVMRLYSDDTGKIVGYAWSTTKKSEYYTAPARELVAGRLARGVVTPSSRANHGD